MIKTFPRIFNILRPYYHILSLLLCRVFIVFFLAGTCNPASAQDTAQKIIPGRLNASVQVKKPYVILISVDGFRYDYARKFNAVNLLRLGGKGITGEGIRPGFPSLTFPNHYSIVTGLYPGHHGLVDNSFYNRSKKSFYTKNSRSVVQDSSWYYGRPLWVLAEQQKMLTATVYWAGSEAAIMGVRPTYNYHYNTVLSSDQRIGMVQNWLALPEEQRPHLICLYFYEVDNAGHLYGPEAPELGVAVRKMDSLVGQLVNAVESSGLPVNFIVLSDHGMETVNDKNPIRLPPEIDKEKFVVTPGEALLQLYAIDRSFIMPTYKALRNNANGFRVYLHNELPKKWQYGSNDDRHKRVGDIVLIPQPGLVFNINNTDVDKGKHGFDPFRPQMMAAFFAWGPQFKSGIKIKAFDNVHIYPLVAKILGLQYSDKIDGKPGVLQGILR
ncbi:MAG: alkaline phosphatase family protein [Chitinophagaceae bacterium]|nr:MAG: alkaline phosphatase family protein [Chitinophagaceae bacterium]